MVTQGGEEQVPPSGCVGAALMGRSPSHPGGGRVGQGNVDGGASVGGGADKDREGHPRGWAMCRVPRVVPARSVARNPTWPPHEAPVPEWVDTRWRASPWGAARGRVAHLRVRVHLCVRVCVCV